MYPVPVPAGSSTQGNRILGLLTAGEREVLENAGRWRRLRRNHVLHEVGQPIDDVYFPVTGVVSMFSVLSTGQAVEAGAVGYEGMVGLPVFLGVRDSATRNVVQVPSEGLCVEAAGFRRMLQRDDGLDTLLKRYVEILFLQTAQLSACNRLHSVEARCARVLLTWNDRLGERAVRVTQDALAEALGVRRASVTEAVSTLAQADAITRGRGIFVVKDRNLLQSFACECYLTIHDAYTREDW